MKMDLYLNRVSNVYAENRLLKFAVVVIALATIANAAAVYVSWGYQRTVVVPPVLRDRVEIVGERVNEAYIREFARYVTGLLLTYHPKTARGQFDELLGLAAPEVYGPMKEELYGLAESIEASRTSSVFHLDGLETGPGQGSIRAKGMVRTYIDALRVEDERRVYVIGYRLRNGRFEILSIGEERRK
ncbi:MAG: type IV conjugative transfer system protein TraE [Candidatus Nitrospinota bacterium M3_3B_026]